MAPIQDVTCGPKSECIFASRHPTIHVQASPKVYHITFRVVLYCFFQNFFSFLGQRNLLGENNDEYDVKLKNNAFIHTHTHTFYFLLFLFLQVYVHIYIQLNQDIPGSILVLQLISLISTSKLNYYFILFFCDTKTIPKNRQVCVSICMHACI